MNPMYDCAGWLDRFGGVTEPPDDRGIEEEPEWQRPEEANAVCWSDCWRRVIWDVAMFV